MGRWLDVVRGAPRGLSGGRVWEIEVLAFASPGMAVEALRAALDPVIAEAAELIARGETVTVRVRQGRS